MTEHNGNGKTYIYGLQDPRDGLIYYVGKSNRPEYRLRQHLKDETTNRNKALWLGDLKVASIKPVLVILEETDAQDWATAERRWIAKGRADGWPLTNILAGGMGYCGNGKDDFSFMVSYLGPTLYARFAVLSKEEKIQICRETGAAMADSFLPFLRQKISTHQYAMRSLIDDEIFWVGSQAAQAAMA